MHVSPIMGLPTRCREDRNCAAVILFVNDVELDKGRGEGVQQAKLLC